VVLGAILLSLAASSIDQTRFRRDSSVGEGRGPAPGIAESVRSAATAAGCTVGSFPSAGRTHVQGEVRYPEDPPTSGNHFHVWAEWGMYDRPLPYRFEVHNLEHGGIAIHLGSALPKAAAEWVRSLWRESPAYLLVVPAATRAVPSTGVTVTSWQRSMACRRVTPRTIEAIRAFRDEYRGAGPEGIEAVNSRDTHKVHGLPAPATPDPGA
jgi:hypothetical protein